MCKPTRLDCNANGQEDRKNTDFAKFKRDFLSVNVKKKLSEIPDEKDYVCKILAPTPEHCKDAEFAVEKVTKYGETNVAVITSGVIAGASTAGNPAATYEPPLATYHIFFNRRRSSRTHSCPLLLSWWQTMWSY